MPATIQRPTAVSERESESADAAAIEREVMEVFVEISRVLGQPRSFAEIYGLLFVSSRPLTMDDLIERLQISKGSASQGLKFLREIEAIEVVEVPDDRRTHYVAVAELRRLAGRFLDRQVRPQLAGSHERLEQLSARAARLPNGRRQQLSARVTMLKSWHRNARRVLPLIVRVLGT
jgi:DNA-binding transcriptional regulator GbsR (MarR family)